MTEFQWDFVDMFLVFLPQHPPASSLLQQQLIARVKSSVVTFLGWALGVQLEALKALASKDAS